MTNINSKPSVISRIIHPSMKSFGRSLPNIFLCLMAFYFIVGTQSAYADDLRIPVTPSPAPIQLKEQFSIYRDSSGQLSVDEIIARDFEQIAASEDKGISLGYSKDVIWLKANVTNYSDYHHWLLEIAYPVLDEVTVFEYLNGQKSTQFTTGDHLPFSSRPIQHRNFVFPLNIPSNEKVTFYIRIKTDSSVRLPITLWQSQQFYQQDQVKVIWQGIYFGILSVMLLYNLFLFISIRESAFIYYVAYVACYILVQLSLNGLSYQYLWPDWVQFNDKAIVFGVSLVVFFGSVFSINFLNLKYNLRWAWYLIGGIALLGLSNFLLAIWLPYSIVIPPALLLTTIGSIAITLAGLVSWYKFRERIAILFTAAWITFLVGSIIIALNRLHILPDNVFTDNAAQVGSALEVVLLSFALADKFSRLKREKKQVQYQAKKSLKQVNELLKDTLTRLEHANQIKNDFLSNISHELRTPMNGIIGGISLIELDDEKSTKNDKEYLKIAQTSAERMHELIESLLQFIDLQAGLSKVEREFIDWHKLEEHISDFLSLRNNNTKLKLSVEIAEDVYGFRLKSDQNKILSIIEILVDNAIKYTRQGQVTVGMRHFGEHQQPMLSGIELYVSDTGIGITPSLKESIFEEFRQIDNTSTRTVGGMGLGLSVAKSLADMLNAEITVDSTPGKGSRFGLKLFLQNHL